MGSHVHKNSLTGAGRAWDESGKFNFVTILLLLVAAAAVYFGIMLVPPYVEHYKFEEKLRSVANLAHRQKNDEVLMREIKRECEILELDLPYDAINVERDPAHGKWIRITARYVREIELKPFGSIVSMEFTTKIHEDL